MPVIDHGPPGFPVQPLLHVAQRSWAGEARLLIDVTAVAHEHAPYLLGELTRQSTRYWGSCGWVRRARERRARIIGADGEYQAARKRAQAASVMAADPAALQLRLLQTVAEVAAEQNSRVIIIVPVPVEILRFLDRAASAAVLARPSAPEAKPSWSPERK